MAEGEWVVHRAEPSGAVCPVLLSPVDWSDLLALAAAVPQPVDTQREGEAIYCTPTGYFVRRDQRWVHVEPLRGEA